MAGGGLEAALFAFFLPFFLSFSFFLFLYWVALVREGGGGGACNVDDGDGMEVGGC